MKTKILILLCIFCVSAFSDSLPWRGTIVFGPWVRVDDAPGPSGHRANHPQMVMDSNLKMYSVWQDDRDNDNIHEIFFSFSTDTGRTWIANKNLSQSAGIDDIFPWLCVDRTNLYVVWQSWRNNRWKIYFTRSTDGGNSFLPADTAHGLTVVNDFNSGINFGPQPKIVSDSKSDTARTYLYLLWADNASGLIQIKLARSTSFGDTFTDLGIVDRNLTNVNRNPYLAVDDSGTVHWAWARGTGGTNQDPHPWIGYNRSTDRGNTFLPRDIIINDDSSGVYRGNPSVTYNGTNGNVIVSWEDCRRSGGNNNSDIWFSRMARRDTLFQSNKRVNWWGPDTNIRYDCFKPVIRMDPNGIMVGAWHDDPGSANYGIHMAAYNDTFGRFSASQSLLNTFTGTSGANFGNEFYAPSLYVTVIDSVTNFFLVWQDFLQDTTRGNIYSVRGWVVEALGDIDVYGDSLDVKHDTINLGKRPAGPPYAKGHFLFANTDSLHNPDPLDGPSREDLDSVQAPVFRLSGPGGVTIDSGMVFGVPGSLTMGTVLTCSIGVFIPEGKPQGIYTGMVMIQGKGKTSQGICYDTFFVTIEGPYARPNLDSLRVFPIPFKPLRNPRHHAIYFYGLTNDTWVRVYDLTGAKVWEVHETDGDGVVSWDAKIDGQEVANGIYIYYIATSTKEKRKGKLSIIR